VEIIDRPTLMQEYKLRAGNAGLSVVVPSFGPFEADTAIIGEGAGETEVRMAMPFVGGAGQLLWKTGMTYGLKKHEVYTTNVVKRQISLGKDTNERFQVSKGEFEAWAGLLRWELSNLPNLRYVVLMGNYALKAILGLDGITNWRGSVLDVNLGGRSVRAICAFNPAYVLREPKFEPVLPLDLAKVKMVREGRFKEHPVNAIVCRSLDEALSHLDRFHREKKPVAYDIETINQQTACYGFSNDKHEGVCIPLRGPNENLYSASDEARLLLAIQRLFDDPEIQFIAQNATFDGYYSWMKDGLKLHSRPVYDTLLAHHTLYPQLPHSLAFLVSQYTTHPFYKDEGKDWREAGTIDDFWRYNCKDTALTVAVYEGTRRELQSQKLLDFFTSHVMQLQPSSVRATAYGLRFDHEHRNELSEQLTAYVSQLRADFQRKAFAASGEDPRFESVNPSSPSQLGELFFQKLRLVGRGTSTDVKNRQRLREHPLTPEPARAALAALDLYAKEQKFVSTYVNVKLSEDGRMRSEYKQHGTQKAPGRLSSSSLLDGTGSNLQNQPQRAHKLFLADPGCAFGYFDLSQAEARVVAYLANIEKWKEDFEKARLTGTFDCHRSLAADMWKMPYDEVPKEDSIDGEPTLRYKAKRCRHGLNYRMEAGKLAETASLSLRDAHIAYDLYHQINPELRIWWKALEHEARTTKQLWSPMGRRWIIMQRIDETTLESIVAFKPQSTVGDKVCQVWYRSENDERWPDGCRIALNIHDALICHGPVDKIKTCLSIMKEHAESPILINGEELIIPADLKMSIPDELGLHRWSTLKKVEL
jgi:uracil-DNA glycosylase family 4